MNSNPDICDMKDDIMSTVTRVVDEVIHSIRHLLRNIIPLN